ncbi:MAG: hypothetical protein GTO45_08750 [Candidatus Aminicenantes bacterium]|nr:hypothetical protein [Candidatus Aminicenantes bacterium]NIM78920.1 hypothetical protein [Candidatus Aminicenantes bacterium]NIN18180.1 hypothetical protein [Candidatus Aminicenantes bacterium]NIN42079.1 hypothetical protein [Candidatus Aminicenantes bacterium]NIN84832.1 hypothetical protein [Candidatus Aminicenantes bacterium]
MVQVDLPGAFAVGQIFALLSKKYLKGEPDIFKSRLLGPLNLYLSCCYSFAALYLMIGWPAWEVMYAASWVENPYNRPLVVGFYVLFLVVMVFLGNLGYMLGHHWYRKGKDKWVVYGSIIGIILTFLPFIVKYGVWWKVGTYAEVEAGGGTSFFQPPFFHGWLVVMGYFFIMTILTGIWFKKTGDRLGGP